MDGPQASIDSGALGFHIGKTGSIWVNHSGIYFSGSAIDSNPLIASTIVPECMTEALEAWRAIRQYLP